MAPRLPRGPAGDNLGLDAKARATRDHRRAWSDALWRRTTQVREALGARSYSQRQVQGWGEAGYPAKSPTEVTRDALRACLDAGADLEEARAVLAVLAGDFGYELISADRPVLAEEAPDLRDALEIASDLVREASEASAELLKAVADNRLDAQERVDVLQQLYHVRRAVNRGIAGVQEAPEVLPLPHPRSAS